MTADLPDALVKRCRQAENVERSAEAIKNSLSNVVSQDDYKDIIKNAQRLDRCSTKLYKHNLLREFTHEQLQVVLEYFAEIYHEEGNIILGEEQLEILESSMDNCILIGDRLESYIRHSGKGVYSRRNIPFGRYLYGQNYEDEEVEEILRE